MEMPQQFNLNLERIHIEKGLPCEPNFCPVALALRPIVQANNPTHDVQVGPKKTFIIKRGSTGDDADAETIVTLDNGESLNMWIGSFDDGSQYADTLEEKDEYGVPYLPLPVKLHVNMEAGWIDVMEVLSE